MIEWHTGHLDAGTLVAMWRAAATRRWVPADLGRVVIHVPHRDAGVADPTARALITHLQTVAVPPQIDVIANGHDDWSPAARLDLRNQPRHRVEVACLRDGALLPAAWLDDLFVVTIAEIAPHARLGIRGVLAAHAALLEAPGALDLDTAFIAHRLLGPDLVIACGHTTFGDHGSRTWWAMGADDVEVERAIAFQAGVAPDTLPVLRHFGRHEIPRSTRAHAAANAPTLHGYRRPAWQVALGRAAALLEERSRRIAIDVGLSARNIHRLPKFIERRVPQIARLWGAA